MLFIDLWGSGSTECFCYTRGSPLPVAILAPSEEGLKALEHNDENRKLQFGVAVGERFFRLSLGPHPLRVNTGSAGLDLWQNGLIHAEGSLIFFCSSPAGVVDSVVEEVLILLLVREALDE